MLDQNTDRNIWMIGAVLVGVMMIIVAKGGFKKTFESVMTWFENIINKGTQDADSGGLTTINTVLTTVDWGLVAQQASTILVH